MSRYPVSSPRIAKIKSPLHTKRVQKGGTEAFVYFNRTEKNRDLILTGPIVSVSMAPEVSAEDSLTMRSKVQDFAVRVIQRRVRSFLRRMREQEPLEEETLNEDSNSVSIHLDRAVKTMEPQTFYFKSGKIIRVQRPEE